MKEKVLILNGSHSEVSIINAAKNLNYHVITTGSKPNAPGNSHAHEYINIDYTNTTELISYCRKYKIKNIIPNANDIGITTFSTLKKELGLNYFDSNKNLEIIHNKELFKSLCIILKIQVPQSYEEDNIIYPCIIKPSDSCGGRGITVLKDDKDLKKAIYYAKENSKNKKLIIEDYLESHLYSFSTFIVDEKVKLFFDDQEFTNIHPYSVTLSKHPSVLKEDVFSDLTTSIEKIAKYLKLTNGVFHLQFMMKDEKPYILEATRRMSGDLYARPLELTKQVNWSELYIKGILNLKINEKLNNTFTGSYGRLCLLAPKNGKIIEIKIKQKLQDIVIEQYNALRVGDFVTNYMSQRIMVLIIDYNLNLNLSPKQIESLYEIKIESD